ncbi:NmrA/HSCARG family protein [Phytohabitans rumicis]|uniref:NmrA-like domain-containing protein n=1 Tax=Phytohabitans rumicis TaxID=1076125 RepID=A0A6V8KWN4_9ACTN|nr:NmrA/HSCARG family protein [Phytohabitans rumicis]GFJ86811.1 hypothetical protein Prum_004530 [Phytohabitans rumicis]
MANLDPVLVTGATGNQGSAVARALLTQGQPVRALTRDPHKPAAARLAELGAELVTGDFDDPAALRRAAAGTSAVFVMSTPMQSPDAEARQGIAAVDAADQAGTGHIVYTSVASALDGTGIPHFDSKAAVERHLATLATPSTVIAPVAFLENIVSPWSAPALAEGRYAFPLPGDVPLQQVAVADIAAFAALVLGDPKAFAGQRVELASVEVAGEQLAAALSRWLGREVTYVELPADSGDDDTDAMMRFFRERGYRVDIPALHAAYPQIGWHDLDSWAAKRDWQQLIPA